MTSNSNWHRPNNNGCMQHVRHPSTGHKEYEEIILNAQDDDSPERPPKSNSKNIVFEYGGGGDDEEIKEEWPYTCEEIPILKTVPEQSLYEKCVSKTVTSSGTRGKRATPFSKCCISFRNLTLISPALKKDVADSVVFNQVLKGCTSFESEVVLGTSYSALDRSLEVALLSMDEGEVCEVTLNIPLRDENVQDKYPNWARCLNCIIHLTELSIKDWQFDEEDETKYESALQEKQKAADLFNQKQTVQAFYRFSLAAKMLMTANCILLETEERNKEIDDLLSTLYSNMAECQIRQKNPTFAIQLCQKALSLTPDNVKALYRQASAAWSLGDVDQADFVLKKLFTLEPNNVAAKRLNEVVQVKMKAYEAEYTQMMKKIFTY